ncbi:hypothetical protein GCM10027347_52600 [Larkinella harenae]
MTQIKIITAETPLDIEHFVNQYLNENAGFMDNATVSVTTASSRVAADGFLYVATISYSPRGRRNKLEEDIEMD